MILVFIISTLLLICGLVCIHLLFAPEFERVRKLREYYDNLSKERRDGNA